MAQVQATTKAQIVSFLQTHKVAVVDCYATWCGPCKMIAPYVHQKTKDTKIALVKVDVDKAPELSDFFKIQAMPTFVAIKLEGNQIKILNTIVGGGQGNVDKVYGAAASAK